MNHTEFQKHLAENPLPVVVDLWAPWCAPCRAMQPAFEQVSHKYAGQVDVLKLNADESPEVLKALGVMSIPTVIAFAGEKEIMRRMGVQTVEMLDVLFDSALHQRKPDIMPPAPVDRVIRSAGGLALIVLGLAWGQSWLWVAVGGVLLFSAFYDRCPIYRALVPRLKALFQRQ